MIQQSYKYVIVYSIAAWFIHEYKIVCCPKGEKIFIQLRL